MYNQVKKKSTYCNVSHIVMNVLTYIYSVKKITDRLKSTVLSKSDS